MIEFLGNCLFRSQDVVEVTNIALDGKRGHAQLRKLGSGLLARFFIAAKDSNVGAAFGIRLRDASSQTTVAARNDHVVALDGERVFHASDRVDLHKLHDYPSSFIGGQSAEDEDSSAPNALCTSKQKGANFGKPEASPQQNGLIDRFTCRCTARERT